MFTAKNLTEKFYHPELITKTVETKSKRDFMPLPGVSGARCIKSPLPPFTKGGMNTATLNKGGGTEVPEGFPLFSAGKRKAAFTLAEVLITLGIIGVVAAMTLPALIQKNNNRVVETRLQKFYSSINQAVQRAEVDYGDKKYWYQDTNNIETDKDGNPVKGSSTVEKWWNKYMAPYIKTIDIKYDDKGLPIFMFADGSALKANQTADMRDWIFYTGDPDKCVKKTGSEALSRGRCSFAFIYAPTHESMIYHYKKGFEPYKSGWDGTETDLYSSCQNVADTNKRRFCAALIQYNGWKIPDNYPLKVSY